ncbi:MAG TPA: SPOCS domain-containing protein [Limnochordales bacterium]
MNFRFEPKTVRMERPIGAATQQAVTEGSLELPANMPDISRIVRLEARPVVTDWEASDNQVAVEGAVDLILLYAHDETVPAAGRTPSGDIEAEAAHVEGEFPDDEPPAMELRETLYRYTWRRAGAFEAVLEIPGVHPQAFVDVTVRPETVEAELHPGGRGVEVEAVVAVTARTSEFVAVTVPVKGRSFAADAGAVETAVPVEHVLGRSAVHVSVDGVLAVPAERTCRRVVHVAAVARPSQAIASPGEVTVAGVLEYQVLYVDEAGQLQTGTWKEQTPFAHTFAVPEAPSGAPVHTETRVTSVEAAPGDGGREIRVWADVQLSVRLAAVQELALVENITGSEKLEVRCRTEPVHIEEWIGAATERTEVTGTLELPQGHPPIERLITAAARARVDEVLVLEDKVVVSGQVDADALYLARSQGQPLHAVEWGDAIAFEIEVSLPGAEPGLEAQADVQAEDVTLDLLNRETVEAQVRLVAAVRLTRGSERSAVVEAVAVPPPDPDPPTWTFVVLQEGDTLWKLSHRYHTDVDRILAANPWLGDAAAPLPPGRKLCIPRRGVSSTLTG